MEGFFTAKLVAIFAEHGLLGLVILSWIVSTLLLVRWFNTYSIKQSERFIETVKHLDEKSGQRERATQDILLKLSNNIAEGNAYMAGAFGKPRN